MLINTLLIGSALAIGINTYRQQQKPKTDSRSTNSKQQKANSLPSNLYQQTKITLQAFKEAVMIPFTGGEIRRQQLNEMGTVVDDERNAFNQKISRNIRLSIGLMGVTLIGLKLYSPLRLLSIAGTLYLFSPLFQKAYQDFKNGRLTTYILDVIGIISMIMMGYIFLVTLLTFIGLLNVKLLAQTEDNSRQQLINVFDQQSQLVWVRREGIEVEIPLKTVNKGEIVVVNAGEIIPVDGTVTEGLATVDQHRLTGESQPIEKEIGTNVFAATFVLTGQLYIRVESAGKETIAVRIGHLLQQTKDFKETLHLRGQQIADRFVAPTLVASGLALPLLGTQAALTVFLSHLGYNMRLLGPISVLNFLHIMAKNGILIKDGRSLEMLQRIDTVVFDKTGTLTLEQPQLSRY